MTNTPETDELRDAIWATVQALADGKTIQYAGANWEDIEAMTNTPETDKLRDDIWATSYVEGSDFVQMFEHARKLERERDDAIEMMKRTRDNSGQIIASQANENILLTEQRNRLAETNYSLAVMLEDERNERNELTEAIQLKLSRIIELTTHNDIYWAIEEIGRLSLTNNQNE